MNLRVRVVFNLKVDYITENRTPNGLFVGTHEYSTSVKNKKEFYEFITNFTKMVKSGGRHINKGTYLVKIKRNVIVSDEADRTHFPSATFPDKEMAVIVSTSDKLLYVADIDDMLKQQRDYFHFEKPKFAETAPIYVQSFDGRDVFYRLLTRNGITNDVVIDSKFNQLYPEKTGQVSGELENFLNNIYEKVLQREY